MVWTKTPPKAIGLKFVLPLFVAMTQSIVAQSSKNKVPAVTRNINSEYEYVMNKVPRGKCLIINNKNFKVASLSARDGTEYDAENLEKTFRWLHFEVEMATDCSTLDMADKILKYSEITHKNYDCFVCCILSHGSSKGIYGTDGGELLGVDYIRQSFRGDNCRSLHGKPKIFFIQACRGEEQDLGQRIHSDATSCSIQVQPPSVKADPPPKVLPVDSDFVFVYATTPGKILAIYK